MLPVLIKDARDITAKQSDTLDLHENVTDPDGEGNTPVGFRVEGAGNVEVIPVGRPDDGVVIFACADKETVWIKFRRLMATNTTATKIIAFYE